MKKKYAFEVAKELEARGTQTIEHYYLDGDCPEIMSATRVLDYAAGILESNKDAEDFPRHLKHNGLLYFPKALEIIEWFGEELYEVDFREPPKSVVFIKEET